MNGNVAWIRINVRLVNATTLEETQDITVDGTASSKDIDVGGGMLGFAGKHLLG